MRDKAENAPARRRFGDIAGLASYVLTVGAVVLGWQIAIQPLIQRAPVSAAVRIAPGSPLVLRRAAEAELAAGRTENAAALGRDALARSPFDVRALRVVGLTEARSGRAAQANELLTLAGNWSLRDDPAHAWLVEYRLRRGDYASAFAHADTLVRRRQDLYPQIFRLFTVAATEDPQRAIPVLTGLLANDPPWRPVYLSSLSQSPSELSIGATVALMLEGSKKPLTQAELQRLYVALVQERQIDALRLVRDRLNRPPSHPAVANPEFDDPTVPEPFQWILNQGIGAVAEIMPGDVAQRNPSLRVEYDGYTKALLARQLTLLEPGRYRLRAESRTELGRPLGRMAWTVSCSASTIVILSTPAVTTDVASEQWTATVAEFSVPADCPSQWLELRGNPLDSRNAMTVWFDNVSIVPVERTGSSGNAGS